MTNLDAQATALADAVDRIEKNLDRYCVGRLIKIAARCAAEHPPGPLPHLVTLRRPLHALAARVLALQRSRPDVAPGWTVAPLTSWRGTDWLSEYFAALHSLSAIVAAAHTQGRLNIRHGETGARMHKVAQPDTSWLAEWRTDIYRLADSRSAAIILATQPLLEPHFPEALAVDPREFSTWAEQEGLAGHGEVEELLAAQVERVGDLQRLAMRATAGQLRDKDIEIAAKLLGGVAASAAAPSSRAVGGSTAEQDRTADKCAWADEARREAQRFYDEAFRNSKFQRSNRQLAELVADKWSSEQYVPSGARGTPGKMAIERHALRGWRPSKNPAK